MAMPFGEVIHFKIVLSERNSMKTYDGDRDDSLTLLLPKSENLK